MCHLREEIPALSGRGGSQRWLYPTGGQLVGRVAWLDAPPQWAVLFNKTPEVVKALLDSGETPGQRTWKAGFLWSAYLTIPPAGR